MFGHCWELAFPSRQQQACWCCDRTDGRGAWPGHRFPSSSRAHHHQLPLKCFSRPKCQLCLDLALLWPSYCALPSSEPPSALQIQIHHRGVYHFKGLAEPIALMQINSATLAGRRFPDTAPSKKAKQLAEPLGLKCTVVLPAQLLHAPTTNQA